MVEIADAEDDNNCDDANVSVDTLRDDGTDPLCAIVEAEGCC